MRIYNSGICMWPSSVNLQPFCGHLKKFPEADADLGARAEAEATPEGFRSNKVQGPIYCHMNDPIPPIHSVFFILGVGIDSPGAQPE
jgi:hypothetical protein